MEIIVNKKLQKVLADSRLMKAYYGNLSGRIETAISVLKFVDNLGEVPNVPPTRRHKLIGNYDNCWALDLDKNHRLIIKPVTNDDNISNISSVEIVAIVDYH